LKRQRELFPLEHRPGWPVRPTRPACMGPSPATSPDLSERTVASPSRSPSVPAVRFGMRLSLGRVERQRSTARPLRPYAKLRLSPRRLAPNRVTQSRSIFPEVVQPKSAETDMAGVRSAPQSGHMASEWFANQIANQLCGTAQYYP
jgi:hypothetical protein